MYQKWYELICEERSLGIDYQCKSSNALDFPKSAKQINSPLKRCGSNCRITMTLTRAYSAQAAFRQSGLPFLCCLFCHLFQNW
mmetsp:Transcript_20436/g.26960  ORF Transcript_20436/g.26960 Transcript_20436/m.26960 type:complete len:83 (+) Transcript_20436:78-326(+)